ncbi:MAG: serine protease [Solirubrobacteraceae bacterium]|nr:serine protease [Solirubrobacteraceae bacterium]
MDAFAATLTLTCMTSTRPTRRSAGLASLLALLVLAPCAAALAPAAQAAGPAGPSVVVRFKHGTSAADAHAALRVAGVEGTSQGPGGAVVARLGAGQDAVQAARTLSSRHPVAWASPTYRARIAAFTPNDTGQTVSTAAAGGWTKQQWDLTGPYGIRAPEAWDLAKLKGDAGGKGVTVAVLDTGVAYTDRGPYKRSPDLPAGRIVRGYDFVGADRYPSDANGHGTFVAGTIAAAANNGYGMVGVAYKASIMPVRVLDQYGEGSSYRVAEGIRYAAKRGADVINVSIELADDRGPISLTAAPDIRSALRYARDRGSIVVAAAGNSAISTVPARKNSSLVIQVGGSTEHGCVADYSNYGPGLDLVAPGGGADAPISEDPDCKPDDASGRNIFQVTFRKRDPRRFLVPDDYEGTSMAAPHVTGAIALMLGARTIGAHPTLAEVKRQLRKTSRALGTGTAAGYYGAGLLDVDQLLGGPPPAPATVPPASPPAPATTTPNPAPTPTVTVAATPPPAP